MSFEYEDDGYWGLTCYECFNKLSDQEKNYISSCITRQIILYERDKEAGILRENCSPTNPVHDGFEDLPKNKQESLMESFIRENLKERYS